MSWKSRLKVNLGKSIFFCLNDSLSDAWFTAWWRILSGFIRNMWFQCEKPLPALPLGLGFLFNNYCNIQVLCTTQNNIVDFHYLFVSVLYVSLLREHTYLKLHPRLPCLCILGVVKEILLFSAVNLLLVFLSSTFFNSMSLTDSFIICWSIKLSTNFSAN